MIRNRLALALVFLGGIVQSHAQSLSLQFKVLTNWPGTILQGVAYGGGTNFICVGSNNTVLSVNFGSNGVSGYTTTNVPQPGEQLNAVAFGGGYFVTGGQNSSGNTNRNLFASSDGGATWQFLAPAFADAQAAVKGIAYNAGQFAAVASAPEIGYSFTIGPPFNIWTNASINRLDLEFFRSVTPLGPNGFAVSGIRNDIRTNASPGDVWAPSRTFQTSNPTNFLGIVSDGAGKLVTVGTAGTILLSTDGGASGVWTDQTFPTADDLFSVAYTADGFIIEQATNAYTTNGFVTVGGGGIILLSPDAAVWTTNGVSWFGDRNANDLTSICLASNGPLQGVAMAVGGDGAVVIGGPIPPQPADETPLTNLVNYAGYPNLPLIVALPAFVTNVFGANVTVDWYDSPAGPNLLASGTASYIPPVFTSNVASTNTFYAQSRDVRTGFVNTNRTPVTLVIRPRPTATLAVDSLTECDYGLPFTNAVTLTGFGPWTVSWNDGTTTNVGAPGLGTNTFTWVVYPTNAFGANSPSNNLYFVTNVVDAFSNSIPDNTPPFTFYPNLPGDITGTNDITVNPRPTATLTPLSVTDCNDGTSYILTNTLTGIGPWTVLWNDGLPQTISGPGPAVLTRQVFPTNSLGTNAPLANVYFVTSVSNSDTCLGNEAGDITGTASITVNPRPTATVVSGDAIICSGGSAVVQANLTGIGPWTVTWASNGVVLATHTGVAATNDFLTVNPANPYPNAATNFAFTVAALTDSSVPACVAQSNDLSGIATITINPRPTANVTGGTNICNGGSAVVQAALTGIGPWSVTWASNGVALVTHTNVVSTNDTLELTPANPEKNAATNFTFTVSNLSDSSTNPCGAQPGDLTGNAVVTVNPRPTAALTPLNTTNCNDGTSYILTTTLTGIGPWTVLWNDGSTQSTNGPGPIELPRQVFPTNSLGTNAARTTVYFVTAVSNLNDCMGNVAGDITGEATVVVNPLPAPPVIAVASLTNCVGVANPAFFASVPAGITVNWYAVSNGSVALQSATTQFTPTASSAGTNVYFAEATNTVTGCLSSRTPVTFVLQDCQGTLPLTVVSYDLNSIVLDWYGNFQLQSAPGLGTNPPPVWTSLTNGAAGTTNYWSGSNLPAAIFFRLQPTNAP